MAASPTTTPKTGTDFQRRLEQIRLEYDRASQAGDVNGQRNAFRKLIQVYMEDATKDGQIGLTAKLQQLTQVLADNLQETMKELGKKGADSQIDLLKALRNAQRDTRQKEAQDNYDLMKGGYSPTINFLGILKGIGVALKSFGCDTTDFVKTCDDLLLEEKAKLPKVDETRLNATPTGISTQAAETIATLNNDATLRALQARQDAWFKSLMDTLQSGVSGLPQAPQANATAADIETTRALRNLTAAPGGSGIQSGLDLKRLVETAAAADGDKRVLSVSEQARLGQMIEAAAEMKLKKPKAEAQQIATQSMDLILK